MKYDWIDGYLTAKPGVERDFKAEWNWRRYMIDGKMFTAVCYDDEGKEALITLKLNPDESIYLREQYPDIIPGYYMNKAHWSSVKADGDVPDDLLRVLLDEAYGLILGGLTKKRQAEITG